MTVARVLRRTALEASLAIGLFLLGLFAFFIVAASHDSVWDDYMRTHGGMSPPPDFVQAHQLSPYLMPSMLLGPLLFVLFLRLYRWGRRNRPLSTA
jgi:hypothetical protein